MKLFNKSGFFQALGVSLYCTLVGLLMGSGDKIFGNLGLPFGPVLILLLFSVSVLVCAVIVLYKPYTLFIKGNKKGALETVISTAAWLFAFLLVFIVLLAFIK